MFKKFSNPNQSPYSIFKTTLSVPDLLFFKFSADFNSIQKFSCFTNRNLCLPFSNFEIFEAKLAQASGVSND